MLLRLADVAEFMLVQAEVAGWRSLDVRSVLSICCGIDVVWNGGSYFDVVNHCLPS